MDKIKNWLGHKGGKQVEPQPLRIEGVKDAPLTAEPDERELAAQALLEVIAERRNAKKHDKSHETHKSHRPHETQKEERRDAAYYRRLSRKIQAAHEASRLRLTRFLAFCEWKLKDKHLPWYGEGSVALLETELYKRLDVVEREGGELKTRWQHCLADVTVRMMQAPPSPEHTETEEVTQKAQKSQKE